MLAEYQRLVKEYRGAVLALEKRNAELEEFDQLIAEANLVRTDYYDAWLKLDAHRRKHRC